MTSALAGYNRLHTDSALQDGADGASSVKKRKRITLHEQQLATALVQHLVPPGTEGDATQAALEILKSINPEERVNLDHTDAGTARCNDCGQTLMGIAGRVRGTSLCD